MKKANQKGMLMVKAIFALLALTILTGCPSAPQALQSELSTLLEDNGYVLYTPFRTTDKPGTVFVLARNERGNVSEFTVVSHNRLFSDAVDLDTKLIEKEVSIADKLATSHAVEGSIAAQLLSLGLDVETAAKYAQVISITFVKPQRVLVLTQEQLAANKNELRDTTLEALRFYKSQKHAADAYLIFETIEVASLKATVQLKSEWIGKVGYEQLKNALKAGATLRDVKQDSFDLTFDRPMMIGYKASRVTDTLIGGAVSSEVTLDIVSAKTINALKK